jgi:parallel beta-helix repeat protein
MGAEGETMKKQFCGALLVCVGALAMTAGSAFGGGTTRLVATSGTDSGSCTTSPCKTIGFAVGQANDGDTVSVSAGTYAESVTIAKDLSLVGHGSTIDATGHLNGIVISGAGSAGASVSGFTVVNAGLEGLFANKTSNLTIAKNILMHNDALGPFHPLCVANPDDCGEALHLQTVTGSLVSDNLVQDNIGGILLTDEDGPTAYNTIRGNRVLDNTKDCGITLASHWFQFGSAVTPDVSGIYKNTIFDNTSNDNGAAGIGIFAGPPGASAWGNLVEGNTAMRNGLPGIAIHSHTAFQNVNDNVVVNNVLALNGVDDDLASLDPLADAPTGISVMADVITIAPPVLPAAAIQREVVTANRISDEDFGIFTLGATVSGLPSNKFSAVATPIVTH